MNILKQEMTKQEMLNTRRTKIIKGLNTKYGTPNNVKPAEV